MKNLKSIVSALVIILFTAFSTAQTKKINTSKSNIYWIGKKITGQHTGTVKIKEGALMFEKGKLIGGSVIVDMTSLTATDLSGDYKIKLNNHLKSADFFETAKFTTAKLDFKTVTPKSGNNYTITANLTIKGITQPVTFNLATTAYSVSDTDSASTVSVKGMVYTSAPPVEKIVSTATSKITINRTKFDIRYKFKTFGDKAISDDFELAMNLEY